MLKSYVTDDAPTVSFEEHLQTIEQAALDGASLIQKIQKYIRQEKHTHFEPLDLTDLVQDCITLTRPYWYNEPRRQGIAIGIEEHLEEIPLVMGSATELREVIINLILNAVQAMPEGGTLSFQTKRRDEDTVCVSITDTGLGMTEGVLKRIFEPLYTTKGDRGTGMGLAVSYGIIQEHDGTIAVESQPGSGSTFILSIPIAVDPVSKKRVKEEIQPAVSARILIVDDEQMVRTILGKLLRLKGHIVTQVSSGSEALEITEIQPFDLIFTDHGMPEMSGSELARQLRTRFPDLPIVLLTGDTEIGAAAEHVNTVLSKPFKIDELQATIRDLL